MDADALVLHDLARTRRRHRLADVDIFEKLYQAYLTVIAVSVVLVVAASAVGDEKVGPATVARVAREGPAWVGAACALVLIVGLRSGGRGGPLTLESAFVSHVLLSPVPRDRALRDPSIRLLGQVAMIGAVVGAMAGVLASHRLPVSSLPLVGWAALTGAAVCLAAAGAAMVVAGFPVARPIVHLLCLGLAAGSVADIALDTASSPGSVAGRLALHGLESDPAGFALLPVALLLAVAGVVVVGGTSIEAAQRRAGLVSQLRFAVTRQDLRTVVLLQRRLAQDAARGRPWVRIPAGRRAPVFRRGLHGLARMPLVRLLRVVALCTVAIAAAVGVWRGTTPLVAVAGLALWAAALDVIEPLAQELDHPTRWAGYPVGPGDLIVRHLTAPLLALVAAACLPVAALALVAEPGTVLQTAGGVLLPACAAAVLGAAASVAMGSFDISKVNSAMPEAIGTTMFFRVAWPPGIVVLASLPLLAARSAADEGLAELPAATQFLLPILLLLGVVGAWLTQRKPETS